PLNRPMGLQPSRAIGCASPFYLLASYSILGIISPHKPKGRSGQITPFRKYPNLVKGKNVDAPNQQWVSDITYLPLPRGFAYLSLITDAYSRKIVGWALHPTLEMVGPLSALKMALKANKARQHLIHHSAGCPVGPGRSVLLSCVYGSVTEKQDCH
ncbi:transposase, partial [Spirosoma soli]